ncbi:hypothetical protein JOQ06_027743 [Pogonophryne albipinna]|uniref:Uncharacterized protein n=1 Tax=Pogonophryne albipinna TaxID=1090488 RepID=A0AAD6A8Y3_9TELE|nr:hypothetical protein JOQ06_027741 [Pogonophryne albipinna]KAJ4920604.1 hypothetical protein JOQ06_027743 [Pogonophryne albipinna]
MWLLVFICMLSVVGGVPINATQEDTSHATDNVTTMSDVQKQGSVIPLNGTQNMTHPATGVLVSMLEPQRSSSETLEGLEDDTDCPRGRHFDPGGQECRAEPVVGRRHAVHHQSGTH